MNSYLRTIGIIASFFIAIGGFVFSLRLFINKFFSSSYSDEDIFQLIKDNVLISILLLVIFSLIVFILDKIFVTILKYWTKNNPVSKTISEYVAYYNSGQYDHALAFIHSKSKWQWNKKYRYFTHQLAARVYLIQGKEKLSFQHLTEAYKFTSSEEDNTALDKIKLQLFIASGSINSAIEIFDNIKNKFTKSSSQTLSHFESLLLEKQGKLEDARSKLLTASQLPSTHDSKELFTIYNNLGRISGLLNNRSDKKLYYEKAKDLISDEILKYQCHVIYQNLIDTYLLLNDMHKYSTLLSEYSSIIDKTNKYDLLEYYNYMLRFYRQTNNLTGFLTTIESQHQNLYPLLTKDEQIVSDIYELQFSFNNLGIAVNLLHKIENNFSLYEKFSLSEKMNAYQIIYQSITSEDGKMILHPFEDLHKYIFEYFRNSFSEIDNYIKNEVRDFQIFEKCSLLEKKVILHNYQNYMSSDIYSIIQNKLKLIDDVTDCYLSSGNVLPGLESSLNYVDECMGSLQNPLESKQVEKLKEQMSIAFGKAEITILQLIKHPEMPPNFIRISRYALFLQKEELSKQYLDRFIELKISIHHYSAKIQKYFTEVYNYFYP